jgi:hypothetical protein
MPRLLSDLEPFVLGLSPASRFYLSEWFDE